MCVTRKINWLLNVVFAIVFVGMVVMLDGFVVISLLAHKKIATPMMFNICIFNLLLITAGVLCWILRYRSEQLNTFVTNFFEISDKKRTITISTVIELCGYIALAMTCGSIIKNQTHKLYETLGVFGAATVCYVFYFTGCVFISAALIKIARMMSSKGWITYLTWMMIASSICYYLFGVGFSLG